MKTPRQEAALEKLRVAIKAAGGAVQVASTTRIPQTHLSTVSWGHRPMTRDMASKLRGVIDLSADEWVELLAPSADAEASAAEATS